MLQQLRSHSQAVEIHMKQNVLLQYFFYGIRLRPMSCPETSVTNYHYSLRNNPEEPRSRLHRAEA